jgi:Na+/phosphate symporter
MVIIAIFPLVIWVIGLLIWVLASAPIVKRIGEIVFFCGFFAFCLAMSSKQLHIP